MATQATLNSPTYHVVLGDWADESTWVAHDVRAIGRDLQAAETLFARHKQWGKIVDSPIRFQAVVAYYGLKRTGLYAGSYADFENDYLEVSEVEDEQVDPTPTALDDD